MEKMSLRGGFLLNYQFVMILLLWKVSNRCILKTRPPNDNLFAQVCSIEEPSKSFKSRPYLTSHVTRIEKTLKLESHLNPSRCLMLCMGFMKLTLSFKL